MMSQGRVQERQQVKDQQSCISVFVAFSTIPSSSLEAPAQARQQYSMLYGRFIEIQINLRRKKLHNMSQSFNFLGGSFNSRDNVRAPIQFGRESQPQHLKRCFFLKIRTIHFHINSARVIRPVKWNNLSLSSIEINKPLPVCPSQQCLVDQIQVQKPVLVVATDQMPGHI